MIRGTATALLPIMLIDEIDHEDKVRKPTSMSL